MRNGRKVNDYINNKGFTITIHGPDEIHYYSDHSQRHYGSICFSHFDLCSISKTNIRLMSKDGASYDCIIAIKRKGGE